MNRILACMRGNPICNCRGSFPSSGHQEGVRFTILHHLDSEMVRVPALSDGVRKKGQLDGGMLLSPIPPFATTFWTPYVAMAC